MKAGVMTFAAHCTYLKLLDIEMEILRRRHFNTTIVTLKRLGYISLFLVAPLERLSAVFQKVIGIKHYAWIN